MQYRVFSAHGMERMVCCGWFVCLRAVAGVWPHTLGSVHSVHFSLTAALSRTFACPSRLGIDVGQFVFDALDKGVIYFPIPIEPHPQVPPFIPPRR